MNETDVEIAHTQHNLSSLWVSRTGSASDWCALQQVLYKCIDTIQSIGKEHEFNLASIRMKMTSLHKSYWDCEIYVKLWGVVAH